MKIKFSFKIPKLGEAAWNDFVGKAWFCSSSIKRVKDKGLGTLEIEIADGVQVKKDLLRTRLENLLTNLVVGNRGTSKALVELRPEPPPVYTKNVMDSLKMDGAVYQFGAGRFAYSGVTKELIDYFDRMLAQFGYNEDAVEFDFPATISWSALKKCDYPSQFPNNLNFLCSLPRDSELYDVYSRNPVLDGGLIKPTGVLFSPTVCIHLHELLSDQIIETGYLSTAKGKCYRNEYLRNQTLERLNEFTMREVMFVGSKEFVIEARERIMRRTIKFVESLGLNARIVPAADPFFTPNDIKKLLYQRLSELKYELQVDINDRGDSIAVGSFNVHKDKLGESFNIRLPSSKWVWSGCCAYGLERWAYAFMCQHGTEKDKWRVDLIRDHMINDSCDTTNGPA